MNKEIAAINRRIRQEVCSKTIRRLADDTLMPLYTQSPSVRKSVAKLTRVLTDHGIEPPVLQKIVANYTPELIPAGTKGTIRGTIFNKIVQERIEAVELDEKKYEVCFEKKCKSVQLSEIPDWFIREQATGRVLIGMNQLSLWGGGQQSNRGSKYIIDSQFDNRKIKLLCVVCNQVVIKTAGSKTHLLFKHGFERRTLCYVNSLPTAIRLFFSD